MSIICKLESGLARQMVLGVLTAVPGSASGHGHTSVAERRALDGRTGIVIYHFYIYCVNTVHTARTEGGL